MCGSLSSLVFLTSLAVAEAPRPAPENVAANVNGDVIRVDEVDAALRRRPPVSTPLTGAQVRQLRRAILEGMIDDLLLRQFLREHGPKVESAEIDGLMGGLAAAQRKRGKSLAEYFREIGRSEAEVRETWKTLLQFQKYADSRATDAELRKYFAENKDFFEDATVTVSHVVIRVSSGAAPGEWNAARARLASLRSEILEGKCSFAAAAVKHSVCPSARSGGKLGVISRKDPAHDERFTRAAFALKVGDISEPTDSDVGVHLIQVTDRNPGTPKNFDKMIDLVRECFAEELRQQIVADLRKRGTIQVLLP